MTGYPEAGSQAIRLARRRLHLPRRRLAADRRRSHPGRGRAHRRHVRRRARGRRSAAPPLATAQANEQVENDLRRAELLAFPLLFLLSLLFFRSLVAALLPLIVGGLAIVGTMLMLSAAAGLGSISVFALNLVTGLGLGLAIDYSLFIVSRYREELARRGPGPDRDAADDGDRRAAPSCSAR